MKLQFFLVHPTHYFAFFLRHLQNAKNLNVTLEVDYLDEVNSKYPWTSNFREGYPSRVSNGSFFRKHLIGNIISERDSIFILAGWERIDKLFLIFLMSVLGRKYLVYTDTPDTYKERGFVKDFTRNLVLRIISKNAYGILVTGEIGVRKVNEWLFKFRRVINLPFFVDLEYFRPDETTSSNKTFDKLIFFSSGRLLNSHKGFDLAIEAFTKLKKAKSLTNFTYVIAGEGPDRQVIEKLIKDNDLTDEIKLMGWTEPGELLSHYQCSQIFIHPSHFDPYPNAVLEAMACGLAVIASDRAGSALDRISDGVDGYLFKSGNIDDLADKIMKLSCEPELVKKFGAAARENAMKWPVDFGLRVIEKIISNN